MGMYTIQLARGRDLLAVGKRTLRESVRSIGLDALVLLADGARIRITNHSRCWCRSHGGRGVLRFLAMVETALLATGMLRRNHAWFGEFDQVHSSHILRDLATHLGSVESVVSAREKAYVSANTL